MTPLSRKRKLLILWSSFDYGHIYKTSFAGHPDFEIELVTSQGDEQEKAGYRRLLALRRRVDAGEFDLVIANNINRSPWPGNKGLGTTLSLAVRLLTLERKKLDSWWAPWLVRGGQSRTPLAVVDSRDGHYVFPWDLPLLRAAKFFFKKDLMYWHRRALMPLQNYYTEKKIKPFEAKLRPLSVCMDEARNVEISLPMKERDIDIFLSGNENNPMRKMVREKCEALAGKYRVKVAAGMLPHAEYLDSIRRAKLAVCVESYGGETWRQYEVAAAGVVPLMSWSFTEVHEPLLPDVHAFYFSYMADHFERVVAEALSDDARLQRMSDAGRAFVREKKGRRGMLNYIVDTTLGS